MSGVHRYRATGRLTHAVTDLAAARRYLRVDDMTEFIMYSDLPDPTVVFDIEWDLLDEECWEVRVVTTRPLTDEESAQLSSWISGQNSDGLGEGFEQQPFAEHEDGDEDGPLEGEDYEDLCFHMSSFDWETNPCTLVLEKGGTP